MHHGTLSMVKPLKQRSGGMHIMIFKIFSAKRTESVETEDTGTYADGMFHQQKAEVAASRSERSSHERDYGMNRKIVAAPVGFV
jgi:hypothetical protein